jgi:hypothetical protein
MLEYVCKMMKQVDGQYRKMQAGAKLCILGQSTDCVHISG